MLFKNLQTQVLLIQPLLRALPFKKFTSYTKKPYQQQQYAPNNQQYDRQRQKQMPFFGNIKETIDQIFNGDERNQLFQIKDLFLQSDQNKRKLLVDEFTNSKNGNKLIELLQRQVRFQIQKNTEQLMSTFKIISFFENFYFVQCPKETLAFDKYVKKYLSSLNFNNSSPDKEQIKNLSSLSRNYSQLVKVSPDYQSTANQLTKIILESSLPDHVKISHYQRFRDQIDSKDILLKDNDTALKIIQSISFLDKEKDQTLIIQLMTFINSKVIDLPALSLLILQDPLASSRLNILEVINEIKKQKLYNMKAPRDVKQSFLSLQALFKHFIIFFHRAERQQNIKNEAKKIQEFTFHSNCTEILTTYLGQSYTPLQEQCLYALLEITKDILNIHKSEYDLANEKALSDVVYMKISLFYQLSKLSIPLNEYICVEAQNTLTWAISHMKGKALINSFCILTNFYKDVQNRKVIDEYLTSHGKKLVSSLSSDFQENDSFTLAYVAYLNGVVLKNKELSDICLNALEMRIQKSFFDKRNTILAINSLESLNIPKSKSIMKKLINKVRIEQIGPEDFKNAIVYIPQSNLETLDLCLSWFQKKVETISPKDVSFFLYKFKKLSVSHLIRNNQQLLSSLKKVFLQHHGNNPQLLVEYRRNGILTDEMLNEFEQHALADLQRKKTKIYKAIDQLYNITRLRLASTTFYSQFISLLKSNNSLDEINFNDFVKLLNSLADQQASQQNIELVVKDLESRIQKGQIELNKQSIQQKKLFYVWQRHFTMDPEEIPSITKFVNEAEKNFSDQNSFESTEQDEEQGNNNPLTPEVQDLPFNLFFEQAFKELQIPFEREKSIYLYKVDFFLPTLKICIELNGELHYFQGSLTPPSLKKIQLLEKNGNKVISINQKEWKENKGFSLESVLQFLKEQLQIESKTH